MIRIHQLEVINSMQILIVIAFIFQMQSSEDLHSLINEVRSIHNSGEYSSALYEYETKIEPLLSEAPLNLRINAQLLEVLIYRKLGNTTEALNNVTNLIELIPDSLPVHKMQALSHQANLYYDDLKFLKYFETLDKLYDYAKARGDGNRMSRAIGNMYYYFDQTNEMDSLETYLKLLGRHLLEYPSRKNEIRFEILTGRYRRDYLQKNQSALIHFANARDLIDLENEYSWYETVIYERVITWLSEGNLVKAEEELKSLLALPGTNQNPNALYVAYSNMVRLYVLKGEIELSEQYFELMKLIPEDNLNYLSIEAGVFAKIALKGNGNAWDTDPVFKNYKKSGLSEADLIGILLAVSMLFYGALIVYKRWFKDRSNSVLSDSLRWSLVE
ncbi:MAG: hypothetical protein RIC57_03335 [Balneola sp.]